ncbi:MAG TPA: RHS repeat-associated core domain-containing protein, partial [Cytophagaceae bacterium]
MDKPKVEAVSPCYGKASINDMSFRSPYTFTWKRRFNQTTEVSDIEYFKLHQNEPIRKTKVTNPVMQNVFQHSVSVPEGTTYVSTPNQKLPYGDYFVEVSDKNGCKVTSDEYQVKKPDFTREYHVFVTIEDKPSTLEVNPGQPGEVNGPKLAAVEMREAIESKVEECVTKKVGEISAKYAQSCRNIDQLDDYVAMTYNMQMQHSTLYYHDMAGNLVKTVPPEGVNKLKVKPTNRNTHPNYTLATTYEYNSLGQKISETTPDAGITKFIYNDKGQLRFSQNIKQLFNNEFSYVKYDDLGRITETGLSKLLIVENTSGVPAPPPMPEQDFNILKQPEYINANSNGEMYPFTGATERTVTIYDTQDYEVVYPTGLKQEFLRNRVSQAIAYNKNGVTSKTWYSYDAHGNVKWLAQKTDDLPTNFIGYEYDLISNKVTKVKYNEQFFHRYSYDEDNRLVKAETSIGGYLWDTDASYTYYAHGPLRRTEIGEDRLQGVDYTYTINGWLKAINSPNLVPSEDPWKDSYAQSEVAADEFSEVIGYHENDFTRTGPLLASSTNKYYLPTTKNLYNGNISTVTGKIGSGADGSYPNTLTGNAYTYDRLNRITSSDFNVYNSTTSTFGSTDSYSEKFKYDGNGNITSVKRNAYASAISGNTNAEMDDLGYDYYPKSNKLKRINEKTTSGLNSKLQDLTQQVEENYVYDDAGYLIKDLAENLEFVWTYNGKISEMIPISSTGKFKPHVKYAYDAQGNRVRKEVNEAPFSSTGARQALLNKIKTTSYARDAQGNIMAVYEVEKTPSSIGEVHTYKLKEFPIYGSDRIGVYKPEALIDYFTYSATEKRVFTNRPFASSFEREVGKKEYELKDHLGNVRVVFSDIRSEASLGGKEVNVKSYYNYYAFGAVEPGRNKSITDYRFNFNGKEMDYEIGWQDYGMRIYRPDIGRFGSVDPITSQYPELTPYQFAGNMPIRYIDLDGLEPADPGKGNKEYQIAPLKGSGKHYGWNWDSKGGKWNQGDLVEYSRGSLSNTDGDWNYADSPPYPSNHAKYLNDTKTTQALERGMQYSLKVGTSGVNSDIGSTLFTHFRSGGGK